MRDRALSDYRRKRDFDRTSNTTLRHGRPKSVLSGRTRHQIETESRS